MVRFFEPGCLGGYEGMKGDVIVVITKPYKILYPGLVNVQLKDVTRDSKPDPARRTIRNARKAAGMTLMELSEKTGISYQQLQRVETGKIVSGNMTAKNLLAIADALGVDIHDLI